MACFLVPLAEAVAISAAKSIYSKKMEKDEARGIIKSSEKKLKIQNFLKKVDILQNMLYGGSFLLAVEHIYHGEVSFVPPFLTAMKTPEEIPVMLHEMATVGVGMALLVTAVWAAGLGLSAIFRKFKRAGNIAAGGIA